MIRLLILILIFIGIPILFGWACRTIFVAKGRSGVAGLLLGLVLGLVGLAIAAALPKVIQLESAEASNDIGWAENRRGPLGRLYHGETAIDFYGRRLWGLGLSALMLLVGIGSLIDSGLNLGIEFEGGVEWEIPSPDMTEVEARAVLDANGLDGVGARVQVKTNRDTGLRTVSVEVGDQPDGVRQAIQDAFATEEGITTDDVSTSSTSSTWGKSITEKALRALIIFLVLVAGFIAWRLEWRMALAAIAAMLHDVLLSVGVYSLLGFEVTPATVVAFLTILGFSLYDTIVVFDKVQENQRRYVASRMPYGDIMNVSMNQVLMRSINTSIAAVLPVLSLLVLGAGVLGATTLRHFALALLVGLITGSYSSIFVAAPLVAIAKEREPKYRSLRLQHATGQELERLVLGGTPSGRRENRGTHPDRGRRSAASNSGSTL